MSSNEQKRELFYSVTECDVTQLSKMIEIMKTAKSKIQELTK